MLPWCPMKMTGPAAALRPTKTIHSPMKGETGMYLQQTQLFWGLSQEFVKKVMSVATLVSFQPGDVVFQKNEPASCFYILIKGQLKVCPNNIDTDVCGVLLCQ